MRLLPNRLSVAIVERTPVAFVQLGSKVSLIDSGGVVMGVPANRQTKFSFPVIHGMADVDPRSVRAEVMKTYNRLMGELEAGSREGEQILAGPSGASAAPHRSHSVRISRLTSSSLPARC